MSNLDTHHLGSKTETNITSIDRTVVDGPTTNGYASLEDIEQAFVRLVRRVSATRLMTRVELAILHPQHVEAGCERG
jgi:hypothetical protein